MKSLLQPIITILAGLTGRMMLSGYNLYLSVFAKRHSYADMISCSPVKREIILVKGRYTNAACTLN